VLIVQYLCVVSDYEGQLWRLLVASAICPGLWRPEERTDEGELVKYESRQFGGLLIDARQGGWREQRELLMVESRETSLLAAIDNELLSKSRR
jgi:hypothetical protein